LKRETTFSEIGKFVKEELIKNENKSFVIVGKGKIIKDSIAQLLLFS